MLEIARGVVAYSAEEMKLIMGQHSREIKNIIGFAGRDEAIHKDDMVLSEHY